MAIFIDTDTYSDGFVQPIRMLGSTLDDYYENTFNKGLVVEPSNLFGSILTDVDTLNGGLITLNVGYSFISEGTLNHGLVNNRIVGALFENIITYYSHIGIH